jgi:ribosomal protein S8
MDTKTLYFLNKLKNASASKKLAVNFVYTKKINDIVKVLYELGLIQSYKLSRKFTDQAFSLPNLTLFLKDKPILRNLKIISKPSNIRNFSVVDILRFQTSLTTTMIFSTNKGVLSHSDCIKLRVGGTLLFILW